MRRSLAWSLMLVLAGGAALPVAAAPQFARPADAYLPVAQQTVRCESNDGRTVVCPFPTRTGVRLVRQLSDSDCVAGRNWGYDARGVWVTQGCRADFASGNGYDAPAYGQAPGALIRCESIDGHLQRCQTDLPGGMELVRQLSDSPCVIGRTWGWDRSGLWVDQGCRGEFRGQAFGPGTRAPVQIVRCESVDGRFRSCPGDPRGGARLVRQLSDTTCLQGQSWGVDRGGLWVNNGCRGEFALGERPGNGWAWGQRDRYEDNANPVVRSVRCESADGRTQRCSVAARGVRLQRQLSDTTCQQGQTWGWDPAGIWVAEGCRGDFEVW